MIIREPHPGGQEKNQKIELAWNPGNVIRIHAEKSPQSWGPKYFPENLDLLAQDAEKKAVLAKIGLGNTEFRLGGETLKGGYIYDLQLQSQEPNVFSRLWSAMKVHAEESELSFLFCYFPQNLNPLSKISPPVKPRIIGGKNLYLLPVHKQLATSGKVGHFSPRNEGTKKEHTVSPSQSGKFDLFLTSPTDSFLENYMGEVQGPSHAAKVWDPNSDFSFSFDYPAHFSQVFSFILNKDLPLFKRPRPGRAAKGWFVYELDDVEDEELVGLLEGIRRRARKSGVSFITACFDSKEEVPPVIEENCWGKFAYDICFFPLKKIKKPEGRTYFHPIFL